MSESGLSVGTWRAPDQKDIIIPCLPNRVRIPDKFHLCGSPTACGCSSKIRGRMQGIGLGLLKPIRFFWLNKTWNPSGGVRLRVKDSGNLALKFDDAHIVKQALSGMSDHKHLPRAKNTFIKGFARSGTPDHSHQRILRDALSLSAWCFRLLVCADW